jgi:hypothetical protein
MRTKAEEYREQAADCERRANEVRDPEAKKYFADCARLWRFMAEQAERGW